MLKGTNLEHAKAHNMRIVLETIRLHGPISRSVVAKQTNLTAQTVSNIVPQLLEQDLVKESGKVQGKRGSPSRQLSFNPEGAYAIGFDLDQEHLTAVLVDLNGAIREQNQTEIDFTSPTKVLDMMIFISNKLISDCDLKREQILGVGVGFPGPIRTENGRLVGIAGSDLTKEDSEFEDSFVGWENLPIVEYLSENLGLAVLLENNATAAAIGESFAGIGRKIRDFFYIYLSTGIGGSIIQNGQAIHGVKGNAGEIGLIAATVENPKKRLGHYFGLLELYRTLAKTGVEVSTPREIDELLQNNNVVVEQWLDEAARYLAPVLASIEYLIDPEAIVFGGVWPETLVTVLIEKSEEYVEALRITYTKDYQPDFICAATGENTAAVWVATLITYNLLSPNPMYLSNTDQVLKNPFGMSVREL